nr:RHS repeat-associated core domain-containing protein [Aminicella lysinilytica]
MGRANPFLYRGYCCDAETGLYYLNSRYYDPQTGRFLNADGAVSTGTGILGHNMFVYCNNRPVIMIDSEGTMMAMCDVGGGSYYSVPYTSSTKQKYIPKNDSINPDSPRPPSTGYKPPKNKNKAKRLYKAPGGRGDKGWLDNKGRVWVPDNAMDGGPGWRRHYKDGSHDHVYPNGKVRTHNILTEEYYWDFPGSFSDQVSTTTGFTGTALIIYIIISEGSRIIPVRNLVPVP